MKNRPFYLHYGITHRCNLSCGMCHVLNGKDQKELSLKEIENALMVLKRSGVVYVSIGGGEPALREDLVEVIRLLMKKGFMARLLTNGTLIDMQRGKELLDNGLKEVSISLDTLDPEKFAGICGSESAYGKVLAAIDFFSGSRKGRQLLLNTVVSPLNIKELPGLCDFAFEKGFLISFIPVEGKNSAEFTFKKEDHRVIDETYDRLIKMKKNKNIIFNSSLFLENSRRYLKSGSKNWECDAGRRYLSMDPSGAVSICHMFGPLGSFSSDRTGAFLGQRIKSGEDLAEKCAGCMRPCWAELSLLMKEKKCLWEMARNRFFR